MPSDIDPIVGNWYRHQDKGYEYEVVAVDDKAGTVEIQHFDGDVEEIDLKTWYDMDIELIEAPEDWTGPVDDLEEDDLGYTETDMSPDDWQERLGEWPRQEGPPPSPEEESAGMEEIPVGTAASEPPPEPEPEKTGPKPNPRSPDATK